MTAEALLSRLEGVRRTGEGRWIARCPAHGDKSPSFSVRELPDGRVLAHCFSGCATEQVLGAIGLTFDALFPEKPIQHAARERQPFPARDVLATLADEALIAAVAAANLAQGVTLTEADRARLLLASERIHEGRRLALGER
jgi:DNA primase